MNEVFAVHYRGILMSRTSGMRSGAVYTREGPASTFITRLKKKWQKYPDAYKNEEPDKLEVVRYVPQPDLNILENK